MKYRIQCKQCECSIWVRGSHDPSVNATELDDNDARWLEACEHIQQGDYEILDEEPMDDDWDHGDSVWPH